MKSLLLLRHAKSSWNDKQLADHERPLKGRGRRASVLIGRFMRENQLCPDLVLSSTARRARETVEILLRSAEFAVEVRYEKRLYMATPAILTETVANLDRRKQRVLLVGHNPGLEDFLYLLTVRRESMPTATLAEIVLKIEKWSEALARNHWQLVRLIKPKELMNE